MSISPFLAQLLVNRGVGTAEEAETFLFGDLESLHDPLLLDGLVDAAEIVAGAVERNIRILIHGDYDADGVTASALLTSFLRAVGAEVDFYIPHRIDEGYGLSREGIVRAAEQGYGLLVSVDCGSSSPEEIALARSLGLVVVITDHHMVTNAPEADAFVNPRGPGCTYPFPWLSGVGVAFKLAQAVATRLGRGDPDACLDLAAVGTIADVMPLLGENRIIVRSGLDRMGSTPRPGLAALLQVARAGASRPTSPEVTARDIAFDVAPRINACGRLEHAAQAVELLLETDENQAEILAREVDACNQRRREMEAGTRIEAEAQFLARDPSQQVVIVEAGRDWHQGVVGIIANRLLDLAR